MSTGPYASTGAPAGGETRQAGQQVAGQAQEKAQQVAGQAQEKAQQVAGQAQEKAQQAATEAKSRLREQLDQRSSQAAGQIRQQAADLRAVSDSLREQGKESPARAAARLAEYAERVGGYLHDRDSNALLADVEDFGRRQPWALAVGGLALGFAASRFMKASSSKRYSTRYREGTTRTQVGDGDYFSAGTYVSPSGPPSPTAYPPDVQTPAPVPPAPAGADSGVAVPRPPTATTGL